MSAIDDDYKDTRVNIVNGASNTQSHDLLDSYEVNDEETELLNGSDADNVIDGSNASSWASDIVSAIDEHEKGIPDVDDKFLSESFEQPKLVGQQTDHLLDPEGHTDSK